MVYLLYVAIAQCRTLYGVESGGSTVSHGNRGRVGVAEGVMVIVSLQKKREMR